MRETDLYPFIKTYLEKQEYEVKAEVNNCDVVAVRGDEPPIVVELKLSFSLPLLLQAIDRQALTDAVYVAVPLPLKKSGRSLFKSQRKGLIKLCRRLDIGLITINTQLQIDRAVDALCDPVPYKPRKNYKRTGRLLKEFSQRLGDPNVGGSCKTPLITAYRQDALRCLSFIGARGAAQLKDIRTNTSVERAGSILQKDHYGWFERVGRGEYAITPNGRKAMGTFSQVIAAL